MGPVAFPRGANPSSKCLYSGCRAAPATDIMVHPPAPLQLPLTTSGGQEFYGQPRSQISSRKSPCSKHGTKRNHFFARARHSAAIIQIMSGRNIKFSSQAAPENRAKQASANRNPAAAPTSPSASPVTIKAIELPPLRFVLWFAMRRKFSFSDGTGQPSLVFGCFPTQLYITQCDVRRHRAPQALPVLRSPAPCLQTRFSPVQHHLQRPKKLVELCSQIC